MNLLYLTCLPSLIQGSRRPIVYIIFEAYLGRVLVYFIVFNSKEWASLAQPECVTKRPEFSLLRMFEGIAKC